MKIWNFFITVIFNIIKCLSLNNSISGEYFSFFLSNTTKFNYKEINNLIVFGDSHSAVRTNLTDMSYTGKNASRGKNWPLWLIEFNNMKLWNYAWGGSVIDMKLIVKDRWVELDLKNQYNYFYENMSEEKKFYNQWKKNNSLFAIWIGNRDVALVKKNMNITEEIDKITDSLFATINDIYDIGARNILIMEAYPRYKFPCNNENLDFIKNNIIEFNNNIRKKTKLFFEKYLDLNIFIYKTVDIFEEIILNCNKYNFKDCVNAWIKNDKNNINDYFWVNSHINEKGNKLLAKYINDTLSLVNFSLIKD